jgi:hypothetical protein
MPEAMPNRQPHRNGLLGSHRSPATPGPDADRPASGEEQPLQPLAPEWAGGDDRLLQEMNQLSEENRHLLTKLGSSLLAGSAPEPTQELDAVQAENEDLRRALDELKAELGARASPEAQDWAERQKEYDNLLEEKSEVIRSLHLKIHELQEQAPAPAAAPARPPNEDELQAVCDELERERAQLEVEARQIEEDRAQLQQDEEALMKQMREMEMSMSRERAELARQRNELQRLHHDIQHALELASRDAALRDRLSPLQRRHQDISNRKGAAPPPEPKQATSAAPGTPEAPPAPPKRNESGLFRRLFRSG